MAWYISDPKQEAGIKRLDAELERASDRAVAVIAGSIVEASLSRFLKQNMPDPGGKIWKSRGENPTGPFGSFAVKIDLAFMLGYATEQAWRDLIVIKDLRNEFAHDLEIEGFRDDSVAARCRNILTVSNHVVDSEELVKRGEMERVKAMTTEAPQIGLPSTFVIGGPEVKAELLDPRMRFVWAARVFTFAFGWKRWPYGPQI